MEYSKCGCNMRNKRKQYHISPWCHSACVKCKGASPTKSQSKNMKEFIQINVPKCTRMTLKNPK